MMSLPSCVFKSKNRYARLAFGETLEDIGAAKEKAKNFKAAPKKREKRKIR